MFLLFRKLQYSLLVSYIVELCVLGKCANFGNNTFSTFILMTSNFLFLFRFWNFPLFGFTPNTKWFRIPSTTSICSMLLVVRTKQEREKNTENIFYEDFMLFEPQHKIQSNSMLHTMNIKFWAVSVRWWFENQKPPACSYNIIKLLTFQCVECACMRTTTLNISS